MKIPFLDDFELPWDLDRYHLEIVTSPIIAALGVTSLTLAIMIPTVWGFPALGLGTWTLLLLAITACITTLTAVAWGALRLGVDLKVMEYFIVVGISAFLTGAMQAFDGFDKWGLRLGIVIFATSVTWWNSTITGLLTSRLIPPLDESLLSQKFTKRAVDSFINAKVRKLLYGGAEESLLGASWRRFTLQLLTTIGLYAAAYSQYRVGTVPAIASLSSHIFLAVGFTSVLSLVYVTSMKSRAIRAAMSGVEMHEALWKTQFNWIISIISGVCFLAIVLPSGLSPIAADNFDGLAVKVNSVMSKVTDILFNFTYIYRADYVKGHDGGYGQQLQMGGMSYGGNSFTGVFERATWLVLALGTIAIAFSIVNHMRKRTQELREMTHRRQARVRTWPILKKLSSALRWLIYAPLNLMHEVIEWLRNWFISSTVEGNSESSGVKNAVRRLFKRMAYAMLPQDPNALVRYLFRQLNALGAKHGVERPPTFTPEEYRRLISSRANTGSVESKQFNEEVASIVSAFEAVKYAPRPATRSLADAAKQAFMAVQLRISRVLGKGGTGSSPATTKARVDYHRRMEG